MRLKVQKAQSGPTLRAYAARPSLQIAELSVAVRGPRVALYLENRDEKAEKYRLIRSRARGRLALGFGVLLVGRSLRRGMILHAIFQGTNPLAQTLAELRQFLGPEDQQGNKEDDQQVHRLK